LIHFGCISTTPRPRLLACVTAMLGVARSSVHLASIRRRPLRAVRGRHASAGVYGRGLALRPKGPARFSPRAAADPFAMPTGTLARSWGAEASDGDVVVPGSTTLLILFGMAGAGTCRRRSSHQAPGVGLVFGDYRLAS